MTKINDFAIVGAGIAGLASAIALARAGHRARVYEKAARIDEIGAGIQIGPNAVYALQQLGVWEHLEPDTFAPDQILIMDGQSAKTLTKIDLLSEFEQRFGAPYRVAHRARLIARLQKVAENNPSIGIRTGYEAENYETYQDRITVQFVGGEALSADGLIAADGIRSRLRINMLDDGPPDYAGHVIFRALLPIADIPASTSKTSVQLWLYPGGHVVHYPVNGGHQLNVVAVTEGHWIEHGWKAHADGTEVTGYFAKAAPELAELLAAPSSWRKWAGADRNPASSWTDGRITLIGDAAHPALPYLAQGAAMALEDAVVLGQHCNNNTDIAAAFHKFENDRRARTAKVIKSSRALGRTYHLSSAAALARNLVMSALPQHVSLSRLAWLYDWKNQSMIDIE